MRTVNFLNNSLERRGAAWRTIRRSIAFTECRIRQSREIPFSAQVGHFRSIDWEEGNKKSQNGAPMISKLSLL